MKKTIVFCALLFAVAPIISQDRARISKPQFQLEESYLNHIKHITSSKSIFGKYLESKTCYPQKAQKNNLQGRVFLSYLIDKKGHLTDVKVISSFDSGCTQCAIDALESSPQWEPARYKHKKIAYRDSINFYFVLYPTKVKYTPIIGEKDVVVGGYGVNEENGEEAALSAKLYHKYCW
ncbi:MAG: energy transducer TonB [Mediterranea sp.]|jgi:TonB family protein|nr:energy transducer TonB [Mediterranea sp.]